MAIEERKCICGCGKVFFGTIRRVYFNAACEARTRRRKNKSFVDNVVDRNSLSKFEGETDSDFSSRVKESNNDKNT